MPTCRPLKYKESWAALVTLCAPTFGLGVWIISKRSQGIAIRMSDHAGVRLMGPGEQVNFGLVWIGAALTVFLLIHRTLFSRIEWDPPKITVYDWRNRIVYEGPTSDIVGIEWFLNGISAKMYRVVGSGGSFVFPNNWGNSSELVERIIEVVEAKGGRLLERESE